MPEYADPVINGARSVPPRVVVVVAAVVVGANVLKGDM